MNRKNDNNSDRGRDVNSEHKLESRKKTILQTQPLEAVRSLLRATCSDAISMEEVYEDLQYTAKINFHTLKQDIANLEALLKESTPDGTLTQLVVWDANWRIDDPNDINARIWLQRLAQIMHEIVDNIDLRQCH